MPLTKALRSEHMIVRASLIVQSLLLLQIFWHVCVEVCQCCVLSKTTFHLVNKELQVDFSSEIHFSELPGNHYAIWTFVVVSQKFPKLT